MKKVLLIGAFDRYNYGDNLMPILLEMYIAKYYPDLTAEVAFEYAALTQSDLGAYGARPSISIHEALREGGYTAVISVGGEVLCSSSSSLFLHMDHPRFALELVRLLRKSRLAFVADLFCRMVYRLPWEYPYIPDPGKCAGALVALNTVGGSVSDRSLRLKLHGVKRRLKGATHLSVRDSRTAQSLRQWTEPVRAPDSALLMSDVISGEFLEANISPRVAQMKARQYVVFQAAPHKVGASKFDVMSFLMDLKNRSGLEVILCPIGYAKGHNDREFLSEVSAMSGGALEYIDDLSLWDIMHVIKHARLFIGTSLHGVITAMSFSVPYLGVNRNVVKLDLFLADWGIDPINKCFALSEMREAVPTALAVTRSALEQAAARLRALVIKNNSELLRAIGLRGD